MKHCQEYIKAECWICNGDGVVKPEGKTRTERLYNLKCNNHETYRKLTREEIKEIVIKNKEVECPECDGTGHYDIVHDYAIPEI